MKTLAIVALLFAVVASIASAQTVPARHSVVVACNPADIASCLVPHPDTPAMIDLSFIPPDIWGAVNMLPYPASVKVDIALQLWWLRLTALARR